MYSKGIISTAFITKVTAVGDLKFEVVTSNRTFIFKAENEGLLNFVFILYFYFFGLLTFSETCDWL